MTNKFIGFFLKQKVLKTIVLCFGLLFAFFPTIWIQEGYAAEETDLVYFLEDFEGSFVQETGFGEIPSGWAGYNPQSVVFSKGLDAHHGNSSLHAQVTPDLEFSGIERVFQGQPGALADIQVQVKASTTGEAYARLWVEEAGGYYLGVTHFFYPDTLGWETLRIDDFPIPSNGEVLVTLLVDSTVSSELDLDCLTSNVQLTPKTPVGTDTPATYDATGTWTYTTSNNWIDQGNSGDCTGGSPETGTITIDQTGDSFTLTFQGKTYPGTISGATYTGSTSYSESGGTTVEEIEVTLTSATSGSGTGYWYWTDGTWYCSGGHDISVTKSIDGDSGGVSGGGGGGGGG